MFKLVTDVLNKDKECCLQRICVFALEDVTKQNCIRSRTDEQIRKELRKFMEEECLVL
jgi:hypothetical protein